MVGPLGERRGGCALDKQVVGAGTWGGARGSKGGDK